MSVWTLVWHEIAHRRLNFALALGSVVLAIAALVGSVTLLAAHDLHTDQLLAAKQDLVDQRTRQLEDEMRKITKRMGFNVVILPIDQNLADLFADDYASRYMPEHYAEKLAASPIVTVNHILPSLEQRIRWPERGGRTLLLVGIRGQIPVAHDPKKPILETVEPGHIVLGSEIAATERLNVGDTIQLLGESFTVQLINPPRGDRQDITVWINLAIAQRLLEKPGLINAIWALECECALADLPKVRAEIAAYLPDTQVIEKGSIALARAEARNAAKEEALKAMEQERAGRDQLRAQRESLAAVLVPLVVLASAMWVGLLTLINVRDRRVEIGLLRALGLRSNQIMTIFLAKAALVGVIGSLLGYAAGITLGLWAADQWDGLALHLADSPHTFNPLLALTALLGAPLMAALAAWIPALIAATQDPAIVLREE